MADFTNDPLPNYVQSLWDKLQELNCPVIKSLEPWNGVEALLNPGDLRLKFLQWIVSNLDESVAESLDAVGGKSSNKDLKATKILRIFSQLKLCAPDEMSLITGRVPKPQQLTFLNYLLTLVLARKRVDEENMHELSFSETSSMSSDATFVTGTPLFTRNYCRHTQFIDNIASKGLIHCFQERVLRVPRDIELELEQQGITQPEGHKRMSVAAQVDLLKKKLQSLEWDYFHQEEFLVKRVDSMGTLDEPTVTAALDKLTTTVEEILLMEDEFNRIFSEQFSTSCWEKMNQTQVSSFGEEMSRLYSLTQEVVKIFAAAKELRKSYLLFETSLKESAVELSDESSKAQKMASLEEWLGVLKNSITKLNEKCYTYNIARNMVEQGFFV